MVSRAFAARRCGGQLKIKAIVRNEGRIPAHFRRLLKLRILFLEQRHGCYNRRILRFLFINSGDFGLMVRVPKQLQPPSGLA